MYYVRSRQVRLRSSRDPVRETINTMLSHRMYQVPGRAGMHQTKKRKGEKEKRRKGLAVLGVGPFVGCYIQ